MTAAEIAEIEAPRTPAEAKRHWMIDRLWWIFLFHSVLISFLVGIVWLGTWPAGLAVSRLNLIALTTMLSFLVQIAVVVAFSLGGPVGRWRARWGNKEMDAQDDEAIAQRAYDGDAK